MPGELAVRLTYNAMLDPAVVATTIALGDSSAPRALPHGAGARMPASVFVTVHGDQADAIDARGGALLAGGLPVAVDTVRRQVELRIPAAVFAPGRGPLRLAAASGAWDPAAGGYAQYGASALRNVAFRGAEPASAWRADAQAAALRTGDLSGFSATVDMAKLADGTDDESGVPASGFMDRIFASAAELRQGRGDPVSRRPGCDAPCVPQYAGLLQPYAVYVPSRTPPPGGYGLTLDLHGCTQSYNIGFGTRRQRQLGERGKGSIVLTPEARGDCYWYFGQAGADVFEAWADVARRYRLDPGLTSIVGSSMGGYGALKLAAAYPDLFARAAGVVPCPGAGIEWSGVRSVPGGSARSLAPLLPALRHVPVMSWQSTGDTTCRYADQAALVTRLGRLGYRYSSLTFDGVDHRALATASLSDAQPIADFLGSERVAPDPSRVTYVVSPALREPEHGLENDHAYWLSKIRPLHADRAGRIDIVSEGIAQTRPPLARHHARGRRAGRWPLVRRALPPGRRGPARGAPPAAARGRPRDLVGDDRPPAGPHRLPARRRDLVLSAAPDPADGLQRRLRRQARVPQHAGLRRRGPRPARRAAALAGRDVERDAGRGPSPQGADERHAPPRRGRPRPRGLARRPRPSARADVVSPLVPGPLTAPAPAGRTRARPAGPV